MYLNNWKTRENTQRTLYTAAFTLLLLATAMLAGCGGNETQNGNKSAGSNSANPVQKPCPEKKFGPFARRQLPGNTRGNLPAAQ